ncbi:hypothetical protein [Actinoallomurus bryophytorum]|nr:hypothetical protein [Actinoallomurus bryophytorum]
MPNASRPSPPAAGGRPPQGATTALSVPYRFRGPADSANGGYMCGLVAGCLDGPVRVTLRRPPPLATPMTVEPAGEGSVHVLHGGALVAEAASVPDGPAPRIPGTVSMAEARAAEGRARYFQDPAYPACFVCGTDRRPGDGLRILPGPVTGGVLWAAPWTPDASTGDGSGSVRPEIAWAALDCPSGIAAAEADDIGPDTAILLGRMTAGPAALPTVGDECQVIGWPIGRDGRKLTAGSALLGSDGEVLAVAETVWITVPRPVTGEGAS